MIILERFDTYLFTCVIGEWLTVKDICLLDTSITSATERTKFTELIGSQLIVHHGIQHFVGSNSYVNWLETKKLSVDLIELHLPPNSFSPLIQLKSIHFLRNSSNSLKSTNHRPLKSLLVKLANLIEVHFTEAFPVKDDDVLILARTSLNLTGVHFDQIDSITNNALNHLAVHSINLKHLAIRHCKNLTNLSFLKTACFSSQLRTLHFITRSFYGHKSWQNLVIIASYCRAVVNLSIFRILADRHSVRRLLSRHEQAYHAATQR